MSTASQTITFTSTPPITASTLGRWLRLTTDPPVEESPVTKAQLAAALNQLVGITDHCAGQTVDPAGIDEKLEKGLGTQATCDQTAAALGTGTNCTAAARSGLPIKKTVYVHWSDLGLAENYQLVPLGSALITSGPQRIRKVLHLVIDVTNSRTAPLRYYIDQEALIPLLLRNPPRWIGNVVQGKRIVQGPSISIGGDQVYLGAMVSGRLELWIPILADRWELSMPGVFIGDKRSYKAKILAISDMIEIPAELEIEDETEGNPAANDCRPCGGAADAWTDEEVEEAGSTTTIVGRDVYCYIRIDWILYKSCTGESVDSGTDYQQVQCPDGNLTATYNRGLNPIPGLPDYIFEIASISQERWTGTNERTITAAEYKDICCYDAMRENCIPLCSTHQSTWTGKTWPGVEADLKQRYGQNTEIVYVAPLGGICGTRTDEFVEPTEDCGCPEGSYFIFDLIENYVDIYHNDVLVQSYFFTGCSGGGTIFNLPPGRAGEGDWTIKAYNHPKEGGGCGSSRRGVEYDYFAGGQLISSEAFDGGDCHSTTRYPGGLFFEKTHKCPI